MAYRLPIPSMLHAQKPTRRLPCSSRNETLGFLERVVDDLTRAWENLGVENLVKVERGVLATEAGTMWAVAALAEAFSCRAKRC